MQFFFSVDFSQSNDILDIHRYQMEGKNTK